jgi:hypothetical protein
MPGDFIKIFSTEEAGRRERGHSMVFTGVRRKARRVTEVCYWSCNKSAGFGEQCTETGRSGTSFSSDLKNAGTRSSGPNPVGGPVSRAPVDDGVFE